MVEDYAPVSPLVPPETRKAAQISTSIEMNTRLGPDGWTIVEISGEIDLATAGEIEALLLAELEAGRHRIMTDLRDVGFMDSSGLGLLLRTYKKARQMGGDLIVVCSGGSVRRVLTASGLDKKVRVQKDTSPPGS